MPVNLQAPRSTDLHPVAGVKLGMAMAGVRKANRRRQNLRNPLDASA